MKLSRLYSNLPEKFPPITFQPGLNVILAEIRDPENLKRDTHNLGKTTLAALIDFCLLKKKHKEFFLFKHQDLFRDFAFFLELQVAEDSFVTVRRSVAEATKVSFAYAGESQQDLTDSPAESWNHWRVPFEKSKQLLDGILGFTVTSPWSYRKPLGYALRLQNDYRDVFQLDRFRGSHGDWKPFLAQLVGLDGHLVQASYDLSTEIASVQKSIEEVEPQLADVASSPDLLEGMILLRAREVEELRSRLECFDFKIPDERVSDALVKKIEASIAALNERRYHLQMSLAAIEKTLNDTIQFDLNAIEKVFSDAKVYFGEQLKHDYHDLLTFLGSISAERAELLTAEMAEISNEMAEIDAELQQLNEQRVSALASLREAETFTKYRKYTERLVDLEITLGILENQRGQMERLTGLKRRLADLNRQRAEAVQAIENNLLAEANRKDGIYRKIKLDFSDFVSSVLDRYAVLSSRLNDEGNIEFFPDILDDSGTATSADMGHTYKKLLCIAFDVAVFSAYLQQPFVHFVYHDGVFESLDDRKKLCLLAEIRKKCDAGLQQIITLIDSDLPYDDRGRRIEFAPGEVVRLLHDQGPDGRLFQMDSW